MIIIRYIKYVVRYFNMLKHTFESPFSGTPCIKEPSQRAKSKFQRRIDVDISRLIFNAFSAFYRRRIKTVEIIDVEILTFDVDSTSIISTVFIRRR